MTRYGDIRARANEIDTRFCHGESFGELQVEIADLFADMPWLLDRIDELRKLADLLTEQGDETGADIRVILAGGEVADD